MRGNQLSTAMSTVNFTPITRWKILALATACITNPEKTSENIGSKTGTLRNAFRNPKYAQKVLRPNNFQVF